VYRNLAELFRDSACQPSEAGFGLLMSKIATSSPRRSDRRKRPFGLSMKKKRSQEMKRSRNPSRESPAGLA